MILILAQMSSGAAPGFSLLNIGPGIIPLYDANGNVMTDSAGNIIYLSYQGPTELRVAEFVEESRDTEIIEE